MRRLHYSIHTERVYCDRVSRFVRFHQLPGHVEGRAALQAKLEMGRATLFVPDTNALREILQHVLALLQQKVQKTTGHQRQLFAFQVYGIPTAY